MRFLFVLSIVVIVIFREKSQLPVAPKVVLECVPIGTNWYGTRVLPYHGTRVRTRECTNM
jgi:hypothetical protein